MDKPTNGTSRVSVQLKVSCGCGEKVLSLKEAADHAEKTGHVRTVHGQIAVPERLSEMRVVRRG